jgi:N-acyl homoserine lactone hydrolase
MKMHILSGGRLRMRKGVYFPDADRSETIELPVSCILLRHAQGNVLFDTGCHPTIATDAEARWGGMAKLMIPIMGPDDNVLSGLKAVGLDADDIDIVVCSHFHTDHCGCNAFFKKATFFAHADELKAARAPDADKSGYLAMDWDVPMPMRAIERETDVMGDGRIVLLPLPGHTPGTTGALVKLDASGEFLLTSDSLSIHENLDREIIPRNTWNAELCTRTFEEISRMERSGVQVICGHDAQQWEMLRKGQEYYD